MATKTVIFRNDHLTILRFTDHGVPCRRYEYNKITPSSLLRLDQLQHNSHTDYRYHFRADNHLFFVRLDWN